MIIVTGATGFIGSHIARKYQTSEVVAVDQLELFKDRRYLDDKNFRFIGADDFLNQITKFDNASIVIHMGAITNTAETDKEALEKWNVEYSKCIWNHCTHHGIPMIYASSAATYGDGLAGFSDDHLRIAELKPLNLYGLSKHKFDQWVLDQGHTPPFWYGLKFFNVYGPFEDHKGPMASSIYHGYHEIKKTGQMTLFRSHNPAFKDGDQARDFIYIQDILKIIDFLIGEKPTSGIYNCGTGVAGTFRQVSRALFSQMDKPEKINWIDTPEQFRAAYQYKTQADMSKLRGVGYKEKFATLEHGIAEYLKYLSVNS